MSFSSILSGGFIVSNFPPTLWLTLGSGDDYWGLIFVLNFILSQVTWTFGNRDDIDPQPVYWQIFDRWVEYSFAVRESILLYVVRSIDLTSHGFQWETGAIFPCMRDVSGSWEPDFHCTGRVVTAYADDTPLLNMVSVHAFTGWTTAMI